MPEVCPERSHTGRAGHQVSVSRFATEDDEDVPTTPSPKKKKKEPGGCIPGTPVSQRVSIGAVLARLETLLDIGQFGAPLEVPFSTRGPTRFLGGRTDPRQPTVPLGRSRGSPGAILLPGVEGGALGIETALGPDVGQGPCIADRPSLDVGPHGDIHVVQLDARVPIPTEVLDHPDGEAGSGAHDLRILFLLAAKGQCDPALSAGDGLQGAPHGAGREIVDGRGVVAMVGTGDHQIDATPFRKEVKQAQLRATGRRAVTDHHPIRLFLSAGPRPRLLPPIGVHGDGGRGVGIDRGLPGAIFPEGVRWDEAGLEQGADQVGLSDPGPGRRWDHDRDSMAGVLERIDEGADVGRITPGGRSVVVHHLPGMMGGKLKN